MNPAEFARRVRSLAALPRESEWIELKHNNTDPQKIGENVSALSNGAALLRKPIGYVLWGVDDDSHDLVGTTFRPRDTNIGNQELEDWLAVQLDPKINVRIHEGQVDGHDMVLFEVPPQPRCRRDSARTAHRRRLEEACQLRSVLGIISCYRMCVRPC